MNKPLRLRDALTAAVVRRIAKEVAKRETEQQLDARMAMHIHAPRPAGHGVKR